MSIAYRRLFAMNFFLLCIAIFLAVVCSYSVPQKPRWRPAPLQQWQIEWAASARTRPVLSTPRPTILIPDDTDTDTAQTSDPQTGGYFGITL